MKWAYFLILSIFIALLAGCNKNDGPYSYLKDPTIKTDLLTLDFTAEVPDLAFKEIFQAQELYILWGDDSPPSQLVYRGKGEYLDSIKPVEHVYASAGTYQITVKTIRLLNIDIRPSNGGRIHSMKMQKCEWVKQINTTGQPLKELDLEDCQVLRQLACGSDNTELSILGLSEQKLLENLSIIGNLKQTALDLTPNEVLNKLELKNSNISSINLVGLEQLENISIESCSLIDSLILLNNKHLKSLSLQNNGNMDAAALNRIFEGLPKATDGKHIITLRKNKGDNGCNRSIATVKGWTFLSI